MVSLVSLVALVGVACSAAEPGVTATESRQGAGGGLITSDTTNGGDEREYPVIDGVVDFGERGPAHPDYDGFLTAAFGDVQAFWAEAFPETYGLPWTPLEGGIYAAYPEREAPIPGCGKETSTYQDVYEGTAFYCRLGDFMAYDDEQSLPYLVETLGREAVAIVLAHEFGHAVQFRADEFRQPTILKEQQADCFAGAWAAHAASGASDVITLDDTAIRGGLVAMIQIADPIMEDGTNPLDSANPHGTGFDRVGAFQDGFEGGPERCKSFFTENRIDSLIDIGFEPADPNAGNLPLVDPAPDPTNGPADIVTLIPAGLDLFWTELAAANNVPFTAPTFTPFANAGPYPSCSGIDDSAWPKSVRYCAADNTIYWDQDYALDLSLNSVTGDMSVGYLFSNAYSDAIQTALRGKKTGEARVLMNDCLTGAWVASIIPPAPETSPVYLSAGDLDEAIIIAIALSDRTTDTNVNGSAFEKVDAFRAGVLGGLNVCRDVG